MTCGELVIVYMGVGGGGYSRTIETFEAQQEVCS